MIPIVIGIVYFYINPAEAIWMPKCVFKQLTGWDCAACGNQRALHAFLHGDFATAFAFNPFVVISIPYLALIVYTSFFKDKVAVWMCRYVQHPKVVISYLILLILWWIGRNIFL